MSSRSISTTISTISIIAAANLLYILPSQAGKTSQSKAYPTSGKLLQLTNGDLMCYAEVMDKSGKKHNLSASFDMCEQTKLVNKQVKLTYKRIKVSDCQSAEPCGKSKMENAIVSMKLVPNK